MGERLEVELGANGKELADKLKKAEGQVKQFGNNTEKLNKNVSRSFDNLASSIAGFVSAGAIISLGKQVLTTSAQFEKFGAILSNTLGSDALSQLKLQEIQDFAAKTPFGVAELTSSFVKLANQGFKPSGAEMRKLGDVAAATGKSFDQLAEAILDATTGEFERLKEFGVRAKDAGDKVIFTFKGVQTTVDKTSESIRNYVTSLGDVEGVSGSMAVISETLTGKISNLGDAWDQMLVSIGSNTSGVFSGAIDAISKAIGLITDYNKKVQIATKFNLDAPLADRLQGLFSRQTTTSELKTENLLGIEQDVSKQVAAFIAGAKSADDFKKAIRALAEQAKRDIRGLTDKNYAKAIVETYRLGQVAIKDAAVNFFKPTTTPGNFGTDKKAPKAKKAGISEEDKLRIEANEFAARIIIDGITREAEAQVEAKKAGDQAMVEAVMAGNAALNSLAGSAFFEETTKTLSRETENQLAILQNFNLSVSEILEGGLEQALAGIGTAIGESLANGTNLAEGLGNTLLSTLGGVLGQLGQMAIATGVAIKSIQVALQTLNPLVAIGAGVALLALAGVVKGQAAKIGASAGGGGGSGVGGGNRSFNVPQPRQSFTPSNSTSRGSVDTRELGGNFVFKIHGTDLIAVLNRAGGSVRRLGG